MKICYAIIFLCIISTFLIMTFPDQEVFASSEQIIDHYWASDTPNSWHGIWAIHPSSSSAVSGRGQSFYCSASYVLSRATFQIWLNYTGHPKPVLRAALYKMNTTRTFGYNGNPEYPFTPIALSDSLNITGESSKKINFTFSGSQKYVMTVGYYCITVEAVGGVDVNNLIGIGTSLNGHHNGNKIGYDSNWWYAYPTYDTHFYVYGAPQIPSPPSNNQRWIGIAVPHVYVAITIWSLAMIVGVGAVLAKGDIKDLPFMILMGIALLICLFITLVVMSPFLGL